MWPADGRIIRPNVCTDKGYHLTVARLATGARTVKTTASLEEPDLRALKQKGFARWHGDDAARRADHQQPRPGCYRGWPGKPSRLRKPRSSSAPLPSQPRSRRYAPDLASGPRERAQAIPASRRRPQRAIVADAPNSSALGRSRRRPWRAGIGAACSCLLRPLESRRLVVQIMVLIVSEDGETAFAAMPMLRRGVKPGQ